MRSCVDRGLIVLDGIQVVANANINFTLTGQRPRVRVLWQGLQPGHDLPVTQGGPPEERPQAGKMLPCF